MYDPHGEFGVRERSVVTWVFARAVAAAGVPGGDQREEDTELLEKLHRQLRAAPGEVP